ncbi:MAG: hypothetical protein N2448_06055 [Caloramator sp.]|nr:hypothetical protein [Caloramator sp.]
MILDFNGNIYFFGQHKYNVYGNETIDYFDFEKIAANAELILEYEDYNYNYNYWYTTDNIILTNNGVVKKIDIKYQYFIGRQLELNNTYIPYNNNFYINDIGNIKYDGFNYYCILGKDNYPYIININNGSITKIPQSGFKFTLDFGIKNNYTMGTYTYTGGIVILNSTDSNFSYPDFEDADMPQSHLSADIIDVDEIQDYTYSDNSEKYLLIVADGEGNNYKQGFGNYFSLGNINIKLGKYLNNKRFNILAVCPSNMYDYILPENKNQEITIRKLLDFSFKEGKLYGKGEYQQALNYIISECYSTPTNDLKIILNEEAVNYNTTYDDYEKDNKMSERWKYIHDPNYFENSNGIFNDSGKWLLNPIINFDKVGKYTVTYNVRDNPTINDAFDNYRLWSIGQNQLNIFVHRRPIADFEPVITENNSTSLLNIIDKSYDLDHLSKANKGIVERRFKWKRYEDTTWTDGLPMTISKSDIILINLIVKDEEGAWSLPVTKSIAFNLSIDANPTYCDWRNSSITPVISVTGSLSIFKEAQYIWTNSTDKPSDTAGWIKSTSTSIPALQNQEGVWYLHMKAIDVDGNVIYRYRGSYKIDLTPPNINAVPSSGEIEKEKNIAIGITDNLSGVKEAWYKWATSNSSMSNLTGFTKFTASPIKTPSDGTYYLHIKAYDNAGNVNYKIFGPYVVDELSVIASVAPNPAKRGQKVVFTINTKGYAKYLKITFPSEIWALDMTTPINLTIPEQVSRTDYVPYYLPLKTPMTLNDNGRLRQPYIIQIEAKKANGKIKTTTVNLDVKGSILDSIKTEIKCNY